MKQFLKNAGFLVCVLGLVLWGCSENSTEPDTYPKTDKEAINMLMEENSSYFNIQTHYGEEDTTGGKYGKSSYINTCFWYRELHAYPSINITIDIVGDSAYVTWIGTHNGILHLFAPDTDTILHFKKDFTDKGERYAVFKRIYPVDNDSIHRRGWRLVEISGAEISSLKNTVQIDSVRLNCKSYPDTVLTDPFALFAKEHIITLTPDEECSLTVYTNIVDTNYVFLHSWRRDRQHHRSRFKYIGNGVFTGVWYAPSNMPGAINVVHHCAFDMISKETLKSDSLCYDANAWLFPYKVKTLY